MANIYAVKFNNSGYVSIPNCSLSTTYTLKVRFKTNTSLATDVLVASSAETGGSPTHFLAVYSAGEMKIRLNGTVVYTSAQGLFQANKKYSITVTVTSGTASITAINETDSTTIVNAASATMSSAFAFDRIGSGGTTTALALTGEIVEVETSNSSDNRRYISTVNTGTSWNETVGAKNGTLTNLATDGTQWSLYETVASPAPIGTVTIGTITKTVNTATIPFTYSAADQTGFVYRVNGGSAIDIAASPISLTGLTAETAYTIEVAAKNASGTGSWSAVSNFTTDALPIIEDAASPVNLSGLSPSTTYAIEIRAKNASGVGAWSTQATFTTDAANTPVAFVGTVANQSATVGIAFSLNLASYFTGSLTPFSYGVTSGPLPDGLTLSGSTISGTPTNVGNFPNIVVTAIDSGTNSAQTNSFSINVVAATVPVSFTGTVPTINGTVGTAITPVNLSTYFAGTSTPFTYSVFSGTLQTGLTLNSSTGIISGTPTVTSTVNIVVRATDANSATANTNSFSVEIAPVLGVITLSDLSSNNNTPWASASVDSVTVMTTSLSSVVVQKTGLTTTAGADLTISDVAIVAGTDYIVAIKIGNAYGIVKVTAS